MREQPNWSDLKRIARQVRLVTQADTQREEAILRAACELAGAPVAILCRGTLQPDGKLALTSFHGRGLEAAQVKLLGQCTLEKGQDDPLVEPSLRLLGESPGPRIQPRRQRISDRELYAHQQLKNLRSDLGFDECVNAVAHLGGDRVCSLALQRPWGERRFTDFEHNLLDVFWQEVATLIDWPSLPARGGLETKGGDLLDLRELKSDAPFEVIAERVGLTPRERGVATWLCRGATNKEIAWELSVSPQTVKRHVSAILRKTQAESRTQAAYRLNGGGHVRLSS